MILIATIFVLVTGGVYLLLQRSMVRAVFGLGLLSHAVNFVLLTTGVPGWRTEPITDGTSTVTVADPPAIVITLATSILMLAMAVIGRNDNMLRHPETGETHRA